MVPASCLTLFIHSIPCYPSPLQIFPHFFASELNPWRWLPLTPCFSSSFSLLYSLFFIDSFHLCYLMYVPPCLSMSCLTFPFLIIHCHYSIFLVVLLLNLFHDAGFLSPHVYRALVSCVFLVLHRRHCSISFLIVFSLIHDASFLSPSRIFPALISCISLFFSSSSFQHLSP